MALITAKAYAEKHAAHWPHVLLDVRNHDEWNEGHVGHAQLLPLPLIPLKAKEFAPDLSVPVVVYCRSGGRSGMAAQALQSMGYQQVFDVEGGYSALHAAGA